MDSIQWCDEFSVGVEEIDNQHKKLIDIINHFDDGLEKGLEIISLIVALNEMEEYGIVHFSSEEAFLKEINCLNLSKHQKEHQYFVEKVKEFKNNFETKILNNEATHVMTFLKNWLKIHILDEDKKYFQSVTK